MAESLTCADCGAGFTPPASLLERYPGWTPRRCRSCHTGSSKGGHASTRPSGQRGQGSGGSRGRSGGAGRSGGSSGSSRAASMEEHLTLAEVLDRYHDGPQTGVFTDGSSIPNPGPGGWGAVYVVDGEVVAQDHGYEPQTTNNRMELTALLAGVELVPDGTPMPLYTDSNLVVRTVNEWAAGWARNGWKRKRGPVENLDLVRPLYERLQQRPELEVKWIKAHTGYRWNEYADALATAWARETL